jgi:hypothetical protein
VPVRRQAPDLGSRLAVEPSLLPATPDVAGPEHVLEGTMMRYTFILEGTVVGPAIGLSDHLDQVMEELVTLEAIDPAIDATLGRGFVQITVEVEAPSPEAGAKEGLDLLRTAIHAAGGATPDWPNEVKLDKDKWGIVYDEHRLRRGELADA